MPKKRNDYVDNAQFFNELTDWMKRCDEAELQGKPIPEIPQYVTYAFIEIPKGLAKSPKFHGYPIHMKEDMCALGTLECVKHARKFNAEKSKNPFSYFTQIVFHAFIGIIMEEKKHTEIKEVAFESQAVFNDMAEGSEHNSIDGNPKNIQRMQRDFSVNRGEDKLRAYTRTIENKKARLREKKEQEKIAKIREMGIMEFFSDGNQG